MTTQFIICGESTENVIKNLQSDLKTALSALGTIKWRQILGKFHYMLLGKHKPLKIEISEFQQESAKSVNPLGTAIYRNLTFDTHVSNIYKRARANVKSLSRIRNVLDEKQAKLLCNSLVLAQFKYCSIICMFCSKISYRSNK